MTTSTDTGHTPIAEELRICSECCEIRLLTDFRRRGRNREDRGFQCRQCHATAERERKRHRRDIKKGRQMQALATALKRKNRSAKQLDTLMHLSIVSAGGYEAMVRDWYNVFQKNMNENKPTPRLVAFYEAITALMISSVRRECSAAVDE